MWVPHRVAVQQGGCSSAAAALAAAGDDVGLSTNGARGRRPLGDKRRAARPGAGRTRANHRALHLVAPSREPQQEVVAVSTRRAGQETPPQLHVLDERKCSGLQRGEQLAAATVPADVGIGSAKRLRRGALSHGPAEATQPPRPARARRALRGGPRTTGGGGPRGVGPGVPPPLPRRVDDDGRRRRVAEEAALEQQVPGGSPARNISSRGLARRRTSAVELDRLAAGAAAKVRCRDVAAGITRRACSAPAGVPAHRCRPRARGRGRGRSAPPLRSRFAQLAALGLELAGHAGATSLQRSRRRRSTTTDA